MKLSEIRKSTSSDLNKELVELKQELFKLRFQLATNNGTLENPMRIKNIKKDIARIKTVIRARELGKEE
ncbi:MAG: 50S ribosomal protein L29 [Clostridia bacterium]|nr:50S ribosomal protein L29 [Clostridia bacterium]